MFYEITFMQILLISSLTAVVHKTRNYKKMENEIKSGFPIEIETQISKLISYSKAIFIL